MYYYTSDMTSQTLVSLPLLVLYKYFISWYPVSTKTGKRRKEWS